MREQTTARGSDVKEKYEILIYLMQKQCASDSWSDFCEYAGLTTEEAEDFFSDMANKLGLDAQKFYFR